MEFSGAGQFEIDVYRPAFGLRLSQALPVIIGKGWKSMRLMVTSIFSAAQFGADRRHPQIRFNPGDILRVVERVDDHSRFMRVMGENEDGPYIIQTDELADHTEGVA